MQNLKIDVKIFSDYVINFINELNDFNANNDSEKKVSPLKLQKILYFTYVYALTNWNKKLWEDHFEKWDFGPVIPKIYNEYSKYGYQPIKTKNKLIDLSMLTNIEKLELEALILDLNEKFNAKELSEISHSFPWHNVKKNSEIKDKDIMKHYLIDTFFNELNLYNPSLESNFKFLS